VTRESPPPVAKSASPPSASMPPCSMRRLRNTAHSSGGVDGEVPPRCRAKYTTAPRGPPVSKLSSSAAHATGGTDTEDALAFGERSASLDGSAALELWNVRVISDRIVICNEAVSARRLALLAPRWCAPLAPMLSARVRLPICR
jgi:hypothetical protein